MTGRRGWCSLFAVGVALLMQVAQADDAATLRQIAQVLDVPGVSEVGKDKKQQDELVQAAADLVKANRLNAKALKQLREQSKEYAENLARVREENARVERELKNLDAKARDLRKALAVVRAENARLADKNVVD